MFDDGQTILFDVKSTRVNIYKVYFWLLKDVVKLPNVIFMLLKDVVLAVLVRLRDGQTENMKIGVLYGLKRRERTFLCRFLCLN